MNVKKKIWLGTLFLFLLILLTGGSGIYYMAKLKTEAKNVLSNNYESLSYCHAMQQQLNNISSEYSKSVNVFEDALNKQQTNVTEPGEKDATDALRSYFIKLKKPTRQTQISMLFKSKYKIFLS